MRADVSSSRRRPKNSKRATDFDSDSSSTTVSKSSSNLPYDGATLQQTPAEDDLFCAYNEANEEGYNMHCFVCAAPATIHGVHNNHPLFKSFEEVIKIRCDENCQFSLCEPCHGSFIELQDLQAQLARIMDAINRVLRTTKLKILNARSEVAFTAAVRNFLDKIVKDYLPCIRLRRVQNTMNEKNYSINTDLTCQIEQARQRWAREDLLFDEIFSTETKFSLQTIDNSYPTKVIPSFYPSDFPAAPSTKAQVRTVDLSSDTDCTDMGLDSFVNPMMMDLEDVIFDDFADLKLSSHNTVNNMTLAEQSAENSSKTDSLLKNDESSQKFSEFTIEDIITEGEQEENSMSCFDDDMPDISADVHSPGHLTNESASAAYETEDQCQAAPMPELNKQSEIPTTSAIVENNTNDSEKVNSPLNPISRKKGSQSQPSPKKRHPVLKFSDIFKKKEKRLFQGVEIKEISSKEFRCGKCDKVCSSAPNMIVHIRNYHAEVKFPCSMCTRTFGYKAGLKKHLVTHYDNRNVICEHCGKGFKCSRTLLEHVERIHLKLIKFWCCYCSKGFYKKQDLEIHERAHARDKPHKCETCDKSFITVTALRTHQLQHKDDSSVHTCHICNRKYGLYEQYRRHCIKYHPSHFPTLEKLGDLESDLASAKRQLIKKSGQDTDTDNSATESQHASTLNTDSSNSMTGVNNREESVVTNSCSQDPVNGISSDLTFVSTEPGCTTGNSAKIIADMPTLISVDDVDFVDTLLSNSI